MLDAFAAREVGKKLAVSQYTEIEADAFVRGYIIAMTQIIANGKSIEDCVRLPAEAAKILKSAQQKMHPTKNGRGKSDKVSTPAVFGG